jgi:hypothetical protein
MHNLELNTKGQILDLIYSHGKDKMASIQFHEDPSHGWLQVPKKLLVQLGILNKITPYSYEDNIYAYLEEDCDLFVFLKALGFDYTDEEGKDKVEIFWELVPQNHTDFSSPIRKLQRYKQISEPIKAENKIILQQLTIF